MPRGNINNLKTPSTEEARERGKKGGKKSGQVRREKRKLQDALQKKLSGKFIIEDEQEKIGGYEAIANAMIKEAIGGNVKAATFIRDTIGEKPREVVDFESESLSGIKIKFVDKSNKNEKKEKDPKIVGDYTPPSNIEE